MNFITINPTPTANIALEWLKIIIPTLGGVIIACFTIFWTQKKENERLKINKKMELEKHQQQLLLEKRMVYYEKFLDLLNELIFRDKLSADNNKILEKIKSHLTIRFYYSENIEKIVNDYSSNEEKRLDLAFLMETRDKFSEEVKKEFKVI